MTITSPHNQKLKEIRKLRQRRRWRERSGRFVAEGEDLLAAAENILDKRFRPAKPGPPTHAPTTEATAPVITGRAPAPRSFIFLGKFPLTALREVLVQLVHVRLWIERRGRLGSRFESLLILHELFGGGSRRLFYWRFHTVLRGSRDRLGARTLGLRARDRGTGARGRATRAGRLVPRVRESLSHGVAAGGAARRDRGVGMPLRASRALYSITSALRASNLGR